MNRNGQEYTEMFNRSGYFERETTMLYWFINNAHELWTEYNSEKEDDEKLEYEVWLKKIYGISVENIRYAYKTIEKDEEKCKIKTETEEKIKSGEIDVFKESIRWAKNVITRKKCSEAAKLGQAAWQANGKKHRKNGEMADGGEAR